MSKSVLSSIDQKLDSIMTGGGVQLGITFKELSALYSDNIMVSYVIYSDFYRSSYSSDNRKFVSIYYKPDFSDCSAATFFGEHIFTQAYYSGDIRQFITAFKARPGNIGSDINYDSGTKTFSFSGNSLSFR